MVGTLASSCLDMAQTAIKDVTKRRARLTTAYDEDDNPPLSTPGAAAAVARAAETLPSAGPPSQRARQALQSSRA